jgi:hypothetical protein
MSSSGAGCKNANESVLYSAMDGNVIANKSPLHPHFKSLDTSYEKERTQTQNAQRERENERERDKEKGG